MFFFYLPIHFYLYQSVCLPLRIYSRLYTTSIYINGLLNRYYFPFLYGTRNKCFQIDNSFRLQFKT